MAEKGTKTQTETKKKEGRSRQSRITFSTEAGRLVLKDFINYKTSGFNPFLPRTYETKEFWESRPEYAAFSFGAFVSQITRMADIAKAQMPAAERKKEEKRIEEMENDARMANIGVAPMPAAERTKEEKKFGKEKELLGVRSLRDSIVAPYPDNNMALVLFELGGNVDDEGSFSVEFSSDGKKIIVHGRVPKEMSNASSLIGEKNTVVDQDADCILLETEIKKRFDAAEQDENGHLWEPREIIELPFRCHKCLFNKHHDAMASFLLRKNSDGYAWGYFWVIGEHVGKQLQRSSTILGEESSVSSNESDDNINDEMSCDFFDKESCEKPAGKTEAQNDEMQRDNHALEREKSNKTSCVTQMDNQNGFKNHYKQTERQLLEQAEKQAQEIVRLGKELDCTSKRNHDQTQELDRRKQEFLEQAEKQAQEIVRLGKELDCISKRNHYQTQEFDRSKQEFLEQAKKQAQEIVRLGKELDCTLKRNHDQTQELDRHKQEIQLLGRELQTEQEQLAELRQNMENVETKLEKQRIIIVELQTKNRRMTNTQNKSDLIDKAQCEQIKELQLHIQRLIVEADQAKLANEGLKKEMNDVKQCYMMNYESQGKQVKELELEKQRLLSKEKQIKELQVKVQQLLADVGQAKSINEGLQNEMNDANQHYMMQDLAQVQRTKELELEIQQLLGANEGLKNEMNDMKQQYMLKDEAQGKRIKEPTLEIQRLFREAGQSIDQDSQDLELAKTTPIKRTRRVKHSINAKKSKAPRKSKARSGYRAFTDKAGGEPQAAGGNKQEALPNDKADGKLEAAGAIEEDAFVNDKAGGEFEALGNDKAGGEFKAAGANEQEELVNNKADGQFEAAGAIEQDTLVKDKAGGLFEGLVNDKAGGECKTAGANEQEPLLNDKADGKFETAGAFEQDALVEFEASENNSTIEQEELVNNKADGQFEAAGAVEQGALVNDKAGGEFKTTVKQDALVYFKAGSKFEAAGAIKQDAIEQDSQDLELARTTPIKRTRRVKHSINAKKSKAPRKSKARSGYRAFADKAGGEPQAAGDKADGKLEAGGAIEEDAFVNDKAVGEFEALGNDKAGGEFKTAGANEQEELVNNKADGQFEAAGAFKQDSLVELETSENNSTNEQETSVNDRPGGKFEAADIEQDTLVNNKAGGEFKTADKQDALVNDKAGGEFEGLVNDRAVGECKTAGANEQETSIDDKKPTIAIKKKKFRPQQANHKRLQACQRLEVAGANEQTKKRKDGLLPNGEPPLKKLRQSERIKSRALRALTVLNSISETTNLKLKQD